MARIARMVAGAVVLALAVFGCAKEISGTATPAGGNAESGQPSDPAESTPGSQPSEPPSEQPSGEPSEQPSEPSESDKPSGPTVNYLTIDICSYANKDTFNPLGKGKKVEAEVTSGAFDDCSFTISSGKQTWSVTFDMSRAYDDAADMEDLYGAGVQTTEVAGTEVFAKNKTEYGCVRAFQLPDDGPTMVVSESGSKSQKCAAGELAVEDAIEIATGIGPAELSGLPDDSAARVDLCERLGSVMATVLGSSQEPERSGAHGCEWMADSSNGLTVSLDVGEWPPSFVGPNNKLGSIKEHPTATSVFATQGSSGVIASVQIGPTQFKDGGYNIFEVSGALGGTPNAAQPKVKQLLQALVDLNVR